MTDGELGAPIALDIDVNAAALAEQACGAGRGEGSVIYLTIGTGIGGGPVVDGATLKGSPHPEIGHVRLARAPGDRSPSSRPSHADCAEGLVAGPALERRLASTANLAEAPELLDLAADYLAQLCAIITLVWSPGCIAIGSGVLGAEGLLARSRDALRSHLGFYGTAGAIDVQTYLRPAALKNAGIEGALLMARDLAKPRGH